MVDGFYKLLIEHLLGHKNGLWGIGDGSRCINGKYVASTRRGCSREEPK